MKAFADYYRGSRRLAALAVLLWVSATGRVAANPSKPVVTQGGAAFSSQGSQFTVKTSGNTFINWGSFNIGTGETTTFVQPSANSLVWNRINDPNPSQILGTLNANGLVVLQNTSGFYVGGQAVLNTSGLVMTTTAFAPPDLSAGGAWDFSAPPPMASIINYGQLNAATGGSIFLIANNIENHGDIIAPEGGIGLYAGKDVLVSTRPDGRGLSAQVSLPQGSVDNTGKLIADAGTIAMNAQVVNQGGVIQANSVREVNGVIQLVAGGAVNLGASSVISATGDAQGTSPGGAVTIKAGNTYSDTMGSTISIAGGAQGGNGGMVEISAPSMAAINTTIDGHASAGSVGGRLVIDPDYITLDSGGTGSVGTGIVTAGSSTGTLDLNVSSSGTAFTGLSLIDLQANIDINVNSSWDLGATTGMSGPGSQLILEAGNNINFATGVSLLGGPGWSVTLEAGRNFAVANTVVSGVPNTAAAGTVKSGTGNITLAGTATVQAQDGSISLLAGNNVVVALGAVRTVGIKGANGQIVMNGGNIDVKAVAGDVDSDANASINTGAATLGGYDFGNNTAPGYNVDPLLGGISTAAGGNVNIAAGGNVYSFMPAAISHTDAGTGAFGPQAGNVTITAGKGVFGNYVTANGNSMITAGTSAGTAAKLLALSLVKGGWTVNANGGIALQEVRNPSGVFNNTGSFAHVFDYDQAAYVNLNAGVGVELAGGSVPRRSSSGGDQVPIVYAPTLNITAGSGGVQLDNNLTLFPSPVGNLTITTTGGGSLFTQGALFGPGGVLTQEGKSANLIMSDSGHSQWVAGGTTFNSTTLNTGDHANPVLHKDDTVPVVLNISGGMYDVGLATPKETQITVAGNMDNCSFIGQNASANPLYDITSITVGGRLYSRNQETFDPLGQALSSTVALEVTTSGFMNSLADANGNPIFGGNVGVPDFAYTPGSVGVPSVLGVIGRFTTAQYQSLVNTDSSGNGISLKPLYLQLTINGLPQYDLTTGAPIVDTAHPVTFLDLPTLTYLYQNSQDVPSKPSTGYAVGGPGEFDLQAGSVDLGSSPGINSQGPAINNALASLGAGATINLKTVAGPGVYQTGDITMFSSTISSWLGGDININAAGAVNVGSQENFGGNGLAQGIYTEGPGSINITADKTIDVAGSRIATFDGGDITLESLYGNVNAGSGAQGNVNLTLYQVLTDPDPTKDKVINLVQTFSGSGIIAYTLPATLTGSVNGVRVTLTEPTTDLPGNITILTPNLGNDPNAGNIVASEGGIVQEPLNGNESGGPTVTLTAGTRDVNGKVLTPGNIDVTGSGVIGGAITLNAAGSITGLIIGRQDTSINGASSINVTAVSGGNVLLSSSGTIAGTVIAVGGISLGSGTVGQSLSLVSGSVSVGGGQSQSTLAPTTASSAATSAAGTDSTDAKQLGGDMAQTDDLKKKKLPLLARLVSRVTVILPK